MCTKNCINFKYLFLCSLFTVPSCSAPRLGSLFVVKFCRIFQLFWLYCCCSCSIASLARCCLRRSQRMLDVCQRCRFVQRYLLQTGVWGPGRALRIGSMCYARLFNRYWLPAVVTDWRPPLPYAVVAADVAVCRLPFAWPAWLAGRETEPEHVRESAVAERGPPGWLCLSSAEPNWVSCCCSCCLCHDRVLMLRA